MNLRAVGCNFRTAPVAVRETLALDAASQAASAAELAARLGGEVVVLSTCNRFEIYLAADAPFAAATYLAERHGLDVAALAPLLYWHEQSDAVHHLFRVAASLDSLVLGEGQIAGQVKQAFETAQSLGTAGPLLHVLFPAALRAAKRVRTETGIARGHASIASVAVDYVREVFDHFHDKTVLVIGAGKMGRLTLKHLADLHPKSILVSNRSPEAAAEVARHCGGRVVPWADLDNALALADIALSTTGAPDMVVSRDRFVKHIQPKRRGPLVVLDIAVPRDFDPAIHDGESVCVFNIDDLTRVREATLADRRRHVASAEAIVAQETERFAAEWNRRRSGPVIGQLRGEVDKLREAVTAPLLARLNGKLTDAEKAEIAGAFRLFQNRLLHGPIAALHDASREGASHTLLESLKKLFRLD